MPEDNIKAVATGELYCHNCCMTFTVTYININDLLRTLTRKNKCIYCDEYAANHFNRPIKCWSQELKDGDYVVEPEVGYNERTPK